MSAAAPALAELRLETTRRGQLRLAVPGVPRQGHPTGQQEPCTRCAAAGVPRLGVSRSGPGSPPLCMSCWRGEQQRRARVEAQRQVAQGWAEVGAAAACPVCGPGEGAQLPEVEDLLPGPAIETARVRRRRDEHRDRPAPARGDCWWCGDRSWLANLRWQFGLDQEAAADAEQERVDAEFARIAAVAEAEATVADLTGWVERLQRILTGYARGNGWGRAVELAADAYARLDAARTSRRGRPPVVPRLVATVIAADSRYESGRQALPGRERTAWLIGHSDRAVYDAWQQLAGDEDDRWARRTRIGGRNSLERRVETGRWNDRAEFDVRPLLRSPIDPATRAAYVPEALTTLGRLLEHAQQLLDAAQAELDGLYAPTGQVPDWGDHARRAQARQATRRVVAATATPEAAAKISRNICRSHPVTTGEYVSSCSVWGLRFSRPTVIHSRHCRAGQPADGRKDGASRSPTRSSSADLETCGPSPARPRPPSLKRPRTPDATKGTPQRSRPSWADWAYDLAREFIPRVPWLQAERLPAVAAVLGARLGPEWTAAAVLAWLVEARPQPLMDQPERPLRYLAAVLDEALKVEDLAPPYPARAHTEYRHQLALDQHHAAQARQAATQADHDARNAAAAAATGTGLAAFRAERTRLGHRADPGQAWPPVAQPGAGRRAGWRPDEDRDQHPDPAAAAQTTADSTESAVTGAGAPILGQPRGQGQLDDPLQAAPALPHGQRQRVDDLGPDPDRQRYPLGHTPQAPPSTARSAGQHAARELAGRHQADPEPELPTPDLPPLPPAAPAPRDSDALHARALARARRERHRRQLGLPDSPLGHDGSRSA